MSNFISRQDAIEGVRELFSMGDCYCDELSIVGMLNSLSTVEPERIAKVIDNVIHTICCEKCKRAVSIIDNYCPGCGAKLDWSENE